MTEWTPIISAFSVLAGVAISQWASAFHADREREYKRKVLLREKYEEMAKYFLDSMRRAGDLMHAKNQQEMQSLLVDQGANNCNLLCLLYFPELQEHSSRYLDASMALFQSIVFSYNPLNAHSFGEQVVGNQNYESAKTVYLEERNTFVSAIQTHAATYSVA